MDRISGKFLALGLTALVIILIQTSVIASPDVFIETYDQWVAEIAPGGHITAIPSWDTFDFENVYPGESSSFAVPTLTAVADDGGHQALHTDFGTQNPDATVIGGFMYTYAAADDANWVGASVFISIKKMPKWNGPAKDHPKWSFDICTHARSCNWEFDIPELTGAPGEGAWDVFTLYFPDANPNDASTPPTHPEKLPGLTLSDVTSFGFDYKGDKTTNTDAYGIDHVIITVPEPSTLILFVIGTLLLMCRLLCNHSSFSFRAGTPWR